MTHDLIWYGLGVISTLASLLGVSIAALARRPDMLRAAQAARNARRAAKTLQPPLNGTGRPPVDLRHYKP